MAFSKNYDKIMAYLNSSPEERQERFKEILGVAVEIFRELEEVMAKGSDEEKKMMLSLINQLQMRFEEEALKGAHRAGYDRVPKIEEAIEEFPEEDRNEILEAQKEIERASLEVQKKIQEKIDANTPLGGQKKEGVKKKQSFPKKKWIQS